MSITIKNKTEAVTNLILKGVKNKKIKDEDKKEFKEKNQNIISKILGYKLRSNPLEAAIVACAIKYGEERALLFANNYKQSMFEGLDDPVCLTWTYYSRNLKYKESSHLYAVALTACKAYCENRKLKRLEPSASDLS